MPASDHPSLDELQEIARRTCFIVSQLTGAAPPTTMSVPELRQFAQAQQDRLAPEWLGVHDAILMCAEEIADYPVRDARIEARQLVRSALRRGEVIAPEFLRLLKDLHDYPFVYQDRRVAVLRAPARIRIAKALGDADPCPYAIAKITEPFLARSKARAYERSRALGYNKRRARGDAFSQARNSVRARLRSKSVDRYVVTAPEQEAPAILRTWARKNGYLELNDEPFAALFVTAGPPGQLNLAVRPWPASPAPAPGSEPGA